MPVVWLIDPYRAGERSQVKALVDALDFTCETKVLEYRPQVLLPHLLGLTTLRGIRAGSRAALRSPWPDLVVTSGVRNEPVCRWIRKHSGGHTRYVHVGRIWGPLEEFDLVVTTPQYPTPHHPKVLHNALTLNSVDAERLARARQEWAQAFEQLPQPRIAVLAGGDSGPFTLGPVAAARLARQASSLAAQEQGSLLVTTSSRTRDSAVSALRAGIAVPRYFHQWRASGEANPYFGILAWADRLIVTGDSIAMLSEACATGKTVQMFDLGGMREAHSEPRDFRLGALLYAALMRWGWRPLWRDITRVHRQLLDSGRVTWLGETAAPTAAPPGEDDLQRAVNAVIGLLGEA